jgi:hypothetical protein
VSDGAGGGCAQRGGRGGGAAEREGEREVARGRERWWTRGAWGDAARASAERKAPASDPPPPPPSTRSCKGEGERDEGGRLTRLRPPPPTLSSLPAVAWRRRTTRRRDGRVRRGPRPDARLPTTAHGHGAEEAGGGRGGWGWGGEAADAEPARAYHNGTRLVSEEKDQTMVSEGPCSR